MKLFLCSNFEYLALLFKEEFFDENKKYKCLLVPFADEDQDFESLSKVEMLNGLGFDVITLKEGYDFADKLDMIFVKGGNTTQLLHYLKKYNQFDKIKKLVEEGVVFVGQSAGAVVAGSDTEWTLSSEPYDVDLKKEFGETALLGFGFVNKLVFVHASRFRFPFSIELEKSGKQCFRVKNKLFYGSYLAERARNKHKPFIVLKDNEAFVKNGEIEKKISFDWSRFPVLDEYRMF